MKVSSNEAISKRKLSGSTDGWAWVGKERGLSGGRRGIINSVPTRCWVLGAGDVARSETALPSRR